MHLCSIPSDIRPLGRYRMAPQQCRQVQEYPRQIPYRARAAVLGKLYLYSASDASSGDPTDRSIQFPARSASNPLATTKTTMSTGCSTTSDYG